MKTKDAIKRFGGVAALAKALSITPEAIYQWGDKVPVLRAYQIEVLSRGELKAETAPEQKQAAGREIAV